jgi:NAD(P)-dependent dehydrogenase (short-subunit alcohol dehydrogenase family)
VQANLLEAEGLERVVKAATAHDGRVRALCNVAGGEPEGGWPATLDADLTTANALTEALVPYLDAGSAIVNVSSLVGIVIGERPAYAAAKAGIVGLTRAHARRLGPRGVRVNCVAPGVIETPAWGEGGVCEEWIRLVPLGRCGYAEDFARVIAFLASDDAAYVSGACVVVDGGLSTALGPEPSSDG